MRLARFFAVVLLACSALPLLAAAPKPQPKSLRDWAESPEAYFLTAAERNEWDLTTTSEPKMQEFIDAYWLKHGPAFKAEVMSRMKFADEHFGFAGLPGSQTARGRVWMILGSPNTERSIRPGVTNSDSNPAMLQNNTIEQRGRTTLVWTYRAEKLPKELNLPSLTVNFIRDMSHGYENIDNLGVVEPQLRRAAELFVAQHSAPAATVAMNVPKPTAAAAPTPAAAEDPLWKAQENLAGTYVTAEPFISPDKNEQPFYAVSFYVPKSDVAFENLKSVLFVGLVKNEQGAVVANLRETAELTPYGDSGDRYVDRSIALPPGKYEGVFALFAPDGTTMLASRRAAFSVPEKTAATASHLLLTSQIKELEKQYPLDPFTFVATKYAVKGSHRFRPTEKIGLFTLVTNPAGDPQPSMTLKMTVSKDGKVIDRTPPEPAPLTQTGPHTWLIGTQFDPNTFKPGHYTIEVQLRDMKADRATDAFQKGYVSTAEFDVE
jgi:GWxTD domain-containing protein